MLKRIIIWVLIIGLAYFFISTVAKSCNNKVGDAAGTAASTIRNTTQAGVDKAKDIASFEDDDGPTKSDYDIDDEDDRTKGSARLDDEDKAYDDDVEDTSKGRSGNKAVEMNAAKEAALRAEATATTNQKQGSITNASTSSSASTSNNGTTASSTPSTKSSSSSIGNNKFLVVAGSYKEKNNATIMVKKLKKMGYPNAEVFTFDFAEYYSVTAGRYASDKEARAIASKLKSKGIPDAYPHKMRSKYFD